MSQVQISAGEVKKLREMTGAGMMECKKALTEAEGNSDKAAELLREWGAGKVAKRAGRETKEGRIASYIHHNNRVGVLVELQCETDFVAKNDEFKQFGSDLCMQIAAVHPRWVSRDNVPEDVVAKERELLAKGDEIASKPENIQAKIIDGRMEKFYAENCLMDQPFVKDDSQTIGEMLKAMIAKTGENMTVARFVRFELGEV